MAELLKDMERHAQTAQEILCQEKERKVAKTASFLKARSQRREWLDGLPALHCPKEHCKTSRNSCGFLGTPQPARASGEQVRSGHRGALFITAYTGTVHERGSEIEMAESCHCIMIHVNSLFFFGEILILRVAIGKQIIDSHRFIALESQIDRGSHHTGGRREVSE